MQALRIDTTVNTALVTAVPALAPLLGHKVEMIALDRGANQETQLAQKTISFDEFLKHRLIRPKEVTPVTVEAMNNAIAKGIVNGND